VHLRSKEATPRAGPFCCAQNMKEVRIQDLAIASVDTVALSGLSEAIGGYLEEIAECNSICSRHDATTAIHTKGKTLQIYKQYERSEETARQIRDGSEALHSWTETHSWKYIGDTCEKLEREVKTRMKKHSRLFPIVTKGIEWEGKPILIHAYKFEPDEAMKLELMLPGTDEEESELPLKTIASGLRCHEFLVPSHKTNGLPPYTRHETNFLTISEYLSQHMPKSLYATECISNNYAT